MAVEVRYTQFFEDNRVRIEDFIYQSIVETQADTEGAVRAVDNFAKLIDRFIETLQHNYQSLEPRDLRGEKSSPVGDGRYRIFFKVAKISDKPVTITLLDIDDNREANLDRFPTHQLRTFDSSED